MASREFACAVLFAAVASAQKDAFIAYPQDTVTYSTDSAVSRGTNVPLGAFFLHGAQFQEGRWQQLIPSRYLPTTAGNIVAVSAVCAGCFTAPTYRRLRITLSATTATALNNNFAHNLTAPVTVLDGAPIVGWQTQQWGQIPFDVPFAYDGRSNLVVEFRKEAVLGSWSSHAMPVNPDRPDWPRAVGIAGAIGSGAADAGVAAGTDTPLQMRLHVDRGATLTLRSDRLLTGSLNVFALGGHFDISLRALPASVQWTFLDVAFGARYAITGIRGQGLVQPTFLLRPRVVPASGVDTSTFAIPIDLNLVGLRLALQAVVLEGGSGQPMFTNGADLIVSSN